MDISAVMGGGDDGQNSVELFQCISSKPNYMKSINSNLISGNLSGVYLLEVMFFNVFASV